MIKQYVNLPQDPAEHHGADLPLEVEASNVSADNVRYAEWWIEPNGDNTPERYLSRRQRAHLQQRITRNRRDHFANTLSLPHVGGDRYDIKCSKRNDRNSAVTIDTVETWRKLFFSIYAMDDRCATHINRVKAPVLSAMRDVFVELVEHQSVRTQVQENYTEFRNGLRHYYQDPNAADPSALPNRPFHLRVLVLLRLFQHMPTRYNPTTSHIVHYQNTVNELMEHNWLVSARARLAPNGPWRDVTAQCRRMGARQFSADLTDQREFWDGLHNDSRNIELDITVREKFNAAGGSIGNLVILAIMDGDQETATQFSIATMVHELGHACNQVIDRERTYNGRGSPNGWDVNSQWYNNVNGGVGDHCNLNASLQAVAVSVASSGQIYRPNPGQNTCVMYHQMHPRIGQDYCNQCKPRVKRADLGQSALVSRNWNRF